jgi:hypothetical protein
MKFREAPDTCRKAPIKSTGLFAAIFVVGSPPAAGQGLSSGCQVSCVFIVRKYFYALKEINDYFATVLVSVRIREGEKMQNRKN